METLDARSLSGSAQEALRVRVVKAVLAGMSQTRAAEVFSVSRRSVNTWVRAFRESGDSALRSKKRGRPLGGALKGWQSAWVVRKVIGKRPEQLRLPFYLWTREAVGQLIEKRFGIVVSIWTIGRYLKRWGFTPQKPVRRALERSLSPGAILAQGQVSSHQPGGQDGRYQDLMGQPDGASVRSRRGAELWTSGSEARDPGHRKSLRL